MFGPLAALEAYFLNAFNFSGRASRSEFWWAVIAMFGITLIAMVIDAVTVWQSYKTTGTVPLGFTSYLTPVVVLLKLVPNLSVSVRRIHDTGRSARYLYIAWVPVVGWMIRLILLLLPGDEDANAWGAPRAPMGMLPRGAGGTPSASHRRTALDSYAVLLQAEREPSPEEVAQRKAEVHDYFVRNVSRRANV